MSTVRVRSHCPICGVWIERSPLQPLPKHWVCGRCEGGVLLSGKGSSETAIDHCVICNCAYFFVEKDFPKALRFTFMGLAIGLSFFTYGISLFVCAILDFALYHLLPFVRICYLCKSEYRGFPPDERIKGYDPHKGVAYDARRALPKL